MTGPTAAKGRFPYPHRTVAEVERSSEPRFCSGCGQERRTACAWFACKLPFVEAAA